ncbi:ORF6N domain-containing protein [Petrimonas sp.]|uniref:ORF6N domain-containing protein n=1 Tax=Petrimonas sp. TaxID=2023866 RepID=UPI003F510C45
MRCREAILAKTESRTAQSLFESDFLLGVYDLHRMGALRFKLDLDGFLPDFMFRLTEDEFQNLKSQFVTSSWGGVRKFPNAFTEQGVAMFSDYNDINEDTRIQLELINQSLAELQVHKEAKVKPRRPIGYIK